MVIFTGYKNDETRLRAYTRGHAQSLATAASARRRHAAGEPFQLRTHAWALQCCREFRSEILRLTAQA